MSDNVRRFTVKHAAQYAADHPMGEHRFVHVADYDAIAARVAEFRAVLDDLYSVQNGCPLPKYQADWDAAMLAAGRLLGYRIPAADSAVQK